jgi:hypothetical protein
MVPPALPFGAPDDQKPCPVRHILVSIIRREPLVWQGSEGGRFLVAPGGPAILAGKVSGFKKGKIFPFPGLNVVLLTGV